MVNFLKYGAIGLVLALSILVYRLIKDAMKKEKLSRHNFYVIFSFMAFTILVMFIGIIAEYYKNSTPQRHVVNEKYKWSKYNRAGYSIVLPDIFKERDITASVQHYQSTLSKEINIKVDCDLNSVTSYDRFHFLYNQMLSNNTNVVYQIIKGNFFVISGNMLDHKKYYYKGILKNKSFYLMSLEYPDRYQSVMEEVITGISRSFK